MELAEVQIPKVVMQTWKNDKIPSKWLQGPRSIKMFLPGWNYVLMTDQMNVEFVKAYFPDFLKTFLEFPYPIQRADAIRYLWFYVNGGLYMDLDICLLKPLDPLFYIKQDLYVIKSMYFSSTYTNALMASQPKTEVMLKCIKLMMIPLSIEKNISKHFIVINSTGPNMFTQAIELTKQKLKDNFTIEELPTELILNDAYAEEEELSDPRRFSKLLGGSSWIGNDSKAFLFVYHNRKNLGALLFILVIILAVMKKKGLSSSNFL